MAGSAARTVTSDRDIEVGKDHLSLVRPTPGPLSVAAEARSAQALAEQTGLLALTASIEAARSARAGRDFQVVDGRIVELAPTAELEPDSVHHDGAGITPLTFKLR